VLHLASFALASLPTVLWQYRWRPEVVLVIEPALMCAPAMLLLASLVGAKSWLHVQDFEVDAAFQMGFLPPSLKRLALSMEKALKMQFDRVSTISGKMLARLVTKEVRAERQVFFPNWVDCTRIFPQSAPNALRAELGIPASATVALYSGNFGEKQDIGLILDAAQRLHERQELTFVMCGTGAAYGRLRAQAEQRHVANIRWLPLQPASRLNDLLNLADIHLLPQGSDSEDLVMPSKLTGMLASGRAVLGTARAGTDLARVLTQVGMVTEPGNTDAFTAALQRLADDHGLRRVLGIAGRQFAEENLDKELLLGQFEENLRVCVGA
jgi:colanic acid biosynthesis glycosyl transferase WcaI